MTNAELTLALAKCKTPEAIEAAYRSQPPTWQTVVACNERAHEIAKRYKRGHLLAKRLDQGAGRSRRYEVDGEVRKVGPWQNGAGCRYAMHDFFVWYVEKLNACGISNVGRRNRVAEWLIEGYAWRALKCLVGR